MSVETELKLHLAPAQLNKLKRHPFLSRLARGRAVTRKLYSVYYDTPQLDLRNARMALRIRRDGKQWIQTLKGGGGVQAGLHSRSEWEAPVAGEALDFEVLKASGGELPPGVQTALKEVFVTDFTRVVRLLRYEDAEIELCLDSGEVRAGGKVHVISEMELELKSGEPLQLFRLALALLDIVPLEIEQTSKAEYGYRLFAGDASEVRRAQLPALTSGLPLPEALQALLWSGLQHLQANVPGAIARLDEEYLHQVRVALRRLRVVLAMTEAYRADAELHALHEQLEALCIEFGKLREWDVFIGQTLQSFAIQMPGHPGLPALIRLCETERARCHAVVEQRLGAQDFQRLLLRYGAWMYGRYWREAFSDGADLPGFAAGVLQKQFKQAAKRGKKLGKADAAQLHALRIACKKLRYSAEMFGALFARGKARRFVKGAGTMQEVLGEMNDITVAHRLLDAIKGRGVQEMRLLILARLDEDYALLRRRMRKTWKTFAQRKPFWR